MPSNRAAYLAHEGCWADRYWCEGESSAWIEIQDVLFAGGTVWNAPKVLPKREPL